MSDLRLDFCSHEAAKYAIRHWYYRDELPIGKLVRIGVWEDDIFRGVLLFGPGASDSLGARYGFTPLETCELCRIALGQHTAPLTRILRVALLLLHRQSPGIRLVITFADPSAGHVGTVYQAANWLYLGQTASDKRYLYQGRWYHSREVKTRGWTDRPGGKRTWAPKPIDCERVEPTTPKLRYGWPMDNEARERLQPFALPYPASSCLGGDTRDTPRTPAGRGRRDGDPQALRDDALETDADLRLATPVGGQRGGLLDARQLVERNDVHALDRETGEGGTRADTRADDLSSDEAPRGLQIAVGLALLPGQDRRDVAALEPQRFHDGRLPSLMPSITDLSTRRNGQMSQVNT